MCEFGENVWRRRRRMAWPILLAHWWLRRQTFSPNVRFSHFFYPAPSCWLAVGSQAMQKRCFKIFVCSFILGYHFPFSNFSWLELPHYLLCSPKVTWKSLKKLRYVWDVDRLYMSLLFYCDQCLLAMYVQINFLSSFISGWLTVFLWFFLVIFKETCVADASLVKSLSLNLLIF